MYGIDLSFLDVFKFEELKNRAKECVNELDQLGYEKEVELLDNLIDDINQLRLNKDKKSELIEKIKDIVNGLDNHVEYYRQAAYDSIAIVSMYN